jgi:hypothetical protein
MVNPKWNSKRTLVCVFDGSRFASNAPKATAEIYDPRPTMRDLIEAVGRTAPQATQQRDGRTCWRLSADDSKCTTSGRIKMYRVKALIAG